MCVCVRVCVCLRELELLFQCVCVCVCVCVRELGLLFQGGGWIAGGVKIIVEQPSLMWRYRASKFFEKEDFCWGVLIAYCLRHVLMSVSRVLPT